MTTSDQSGQGPLTRKQLREIRLTGSTPVITDEVSAAAPAPTGEPDAAVEKPVVEEPVIEEPVADKPVAEMPETPTPNADQPADESAVEPASDPTPVSEASVEASSVSAPAPLTRRQARDQERVRTASVPVVEPEAAAPVAAPTRPDKAQPAPAPVSQAPIVAAVPGFSASPAATDEDLADDDARDVEVAIAPVSAAGSNATAGDVPLELVAEERQDDADDVDVVLGLDQEDTNSESDDVLADVGGDDEIIAPDERPTVNPAFGASVADETRKPLAPSFDELLSVDSSASQHTSPSALIFTPSPGEGSLSGPVASTGEILVTGSYELPRGIGSQGHAHGVADGKDVDAVLIDGELAPASSPTPIAASSAVSTIKPAGEVIRPPAPEKGNRLMLTLAIVAGGLALALAVALVVAFTTNVF